MAGMHCLVFWCTIQSNLDYADLLELDEIVQVIEGLDNQNININEEQNWFNQESSILSWNNTLIMNEHLWC